MLILSSIPSNGAGKSPADKRAGRQWLVRRFDLWESPSEIEYIDILLKKDIRNNSAWNHRFFVVFGRDQDVPKEIVDREIR